MIKNIVNFIAQSWRELRDQQVNELESYKENSINLYVTYHNTSFNQQMRKVQEEIHELIEEFDNFDFYRTKKLKKRTLEEGIDVITAVYKALIDHVADNQKDIKDACDIVLEKNKKRGYLK